MKQTQLLQIGALAKQARVNIQTIRYYERRDLLRPRQKSESGYRLFEPDAVKTIGFIKQAQKLGFSLATIADLLALREPGAVNCQKVRGKAEAKLVEIQEKLHQLERMKQTIQDLIQSCKAQTEQKGCPILAGMEVNTHEPPWRLAEGLHCECLEP